jgi:hypothetical protein
MVTEMGGRRRRHNAAERRAVLDRLASSRQSVSAFCQAKSIGLATLRRWKGETDAPAVRTHRSPVPSGFVDLGALGGALTIELELGGGVVLRVRLG